MKKEVKEVAPGTFQITSDDERFYSITKIDPKTGLPTIVWKASITWVSSYLVKDTSLTKWVASKGYDESQAEMQAKGDRGSRIHQACEQLVKTGSVKMSDKFLDKGKGIEKELTPDEYENVMFFRSWLIEKQPKILFVERMVEDQDGKYNIAGTVDLGVEINGKKTIVDIKTGNHYMEHDMQVSAYRYCLGKGWEDADMMALHLGRKLNKKGYREIEIEDRLPLFFAVMESWKAKTKDRGPLQREFPVEITLDKTLQYTPLT